MRFPLGAAAINKRFGEGSGDWPGGGTTGDTGVWPEVKRTGDTGDWPGGVRTGDLFAFRRLRPSSDNKKEAFFPLILRPPVSQV